MSNMSQIAGPVLAHPQAHSNVLSVRAKAYIFADPKSQALLEQVERVARSDATVLIVGETGTGKELVARHLHRESARKGDFVAVNCGALSQTLAEAELFGHQAGAFTGATEARAGWFEVANGGTLFLDEVGDLPLPLQVKLLRVLQEREVVRLGSRRPIPLDVRLIAATNLNLEDAVEAGHFRRDLYYRLNVVTLDVPTLAERRGDILPLADYFLRLYCKRMQSEVPRVDVATEAALLAYSWPGNIRELENVMHSALLICRNEVIRPENLRLSTRARADANGAENEPPLAVIRRQLERLFATEQLDLHQTLEEMLVRAGYAHCHSNQMRTARLLGLSRNMMRTLLKRFGLLGSELEST
jgi:sigma-54-specific transcriptional regulator